MTYAEHSGHAHYVTVRDAFGAGRTCLAAGPYRTHSEAEQHVEAVRAHVSGQSFSDVYSTAFLAFGTARVTLRPGRQAPAGKFNAALTNA